MNDAAAGWKTDPTGRHEHRYWDGTGWTDLVSDEGVSGRDAGPVPPAPVAAAPVEGRDTYTGWAPRSDAPEPTPAPRTSAPRRAPSAGHLSTPGPRAVASTRNVDRRVLFLVGAALVLLLAGFLLLRGGGGGDSETERRLSLVLRQIGLSQEDADCVAGEIADRVGGDELSQVEDLTQMPTDLSDEFVAEFEQAQLDAVEECDVQPLGG